jgi:hypothetical protein
LCPRVRNRAIVFNSTRCDVCEVALRFDLRIGVIKLGGALQFGLGSGLFCVEMGPIHREMLSMCLVGLCHPKITISFGLDPILRGSFGPSLELLESWLLRRAAGALALDLDPDGVIAHG